GRRGRVRDRGRHGRLGGEGRQPDVVGKHERELTEDPVPRHPAGERGAERRNARLLVRRERVLRLHLRGIGCRNRGQLVLDRRQLRLSALDLAARGEEGGGGERGEQDGGGDRNQDDP